MGKTLKIGTRGSPLALAQTELLAAALRRKHPHLLEPGAVEIVKITTSGDRTQAQNLPLPEAGGGKGLFVKEIEEALLSGDIDCAVHSMKDVPALLPGGLVISCLLPRDDPRDAFFSNKAATLDDLPPGAVVGTSGPRRQALVLARRPDLKVVPFRGNVDTRLKKLEAGAADATLLAVAGLNRLGLAHLVKNILEPDVMLPAAGQGAIGIEAREKDEAVLALLAAVHCHVTGLRVAAERAYLAVMEGSCRSPLAALMEVPDPEGRARFDVLAAKPDGSDVRRHSYMMTIQQDGDAQRLGRHAGQEMLAVLPPGFLC